MTEPTEAGRQLAADLANAEASHHIYHVDDFHTGDTYIALARLAAQSIARDAELAETRADLWEIDRLCAANGWFCNKVEPRGKITAIAAKHRETDPLVEAFQRMPETFDAQIWADTARKTFADLGYELSKRGIELKEVGDV